MTERRTVILARLEEIVRDALDRPDLVLTDRTVARDVPGWDSIVMVNILLQAQESFGIRFRTTEIDGLVDVGDFVDRIEAKTAAP